VNGKGGSKLPPLEKFSYRSHPYIDLVHRLSLVLRVMSKVNVHEAKTRFSRLLRRVAAGEEITIANRGVPVARLVPVPAEETTRKLGTLRDQVVIPDDFDAPLPDEVLRAFEGRRSRRSKKKS
jgi:prevent-host-death family protein